MHRIHDQDIPLSLDTYPELKLAFERAMQVSWGEYLLTRMNETSSKSELQQTLMRLYRS